MDQLTAKAEQNHFPGFIFHGMTTGKETGNISRINQDFWKGDKSGVLVVCDGVGGHGDGDKASRIVVSKVVGDIKRNLGPIPLEERSPTVVANIALKAVEAAHTALLNFQKQHQSKAMTTLSLVVAAGPSTQEGTPFVFVNCGDSQIEIAGRIGHPGITPITTPDSALPTTESGARELDQTSHSAFFDGDGGDYLKMMFGYRNVIGSCIGQENATFEARHVILKRGEMLLLFSDGVGDPITLGERITAHGVSRSRVEFLENLFACVKLRNQSPRHIRRKNDDTTGAICYIHSEVDERTVETPLGFQIVSQRLEEERQTGDLYKTTMIQQ